MMVVGMPTHKSMLHAYNGVEDSFAGCLVKNIPGNLFLKFPGIGLFHINLLSIAAG
jgi:hypothetical protein